MNEGATVGQLIGIGEHIMEEYVADDLVYAGQTLRPWRQQDLPIPEWQI
jgi:hypothetical protein